MKFWLKECPRCKGDLKAESDIHGNYIACVQCGYILSQAEEIRLLASGALKERVLATTHGERPGGRR
jgi:ribosomal protein S27AE